MISDQSLAAVSIQSVPDESDISDIASPQSLNLRKSFGSRTVRILLKISGSFLRIQRSLGAVNPGIARFPVIRCRSGTASSSSKHSFPDLPSFQRIAGRNTSPFLSKSTAPCIWPDNPIPFRSDKEVCDFRSSIPFSKARHHSSGSCSDQRGWGLLTSSDMLLSAKTELLSSMTSNFIAEVPKSIPRNIKKINMCYKHKYPNARISKIH